MSNYVQACHYSCALLRPAYKSNVYIRIHRTWPDGKGQCDGCSPAEVELARWMQLTMLEICLHLLYPSGIVGWDTQVKRIKSHTVQPCGIEKTRRIRAYHGISISKKAASFFAGVVSHGFTRREGRT